MEQQPDLHDTFDPLVRRLVRESARGVIDRTGLPRHEQEDVQQELMLHYWLKRDAYRPDRGARSTFAKVVIRRKAAALTIRIRAKRRSGIRIAMGADGMPEIEPKSLEARSLAASFVAAGREDEALHNLHLDVRGAIGRMRRGDRLLARRLMRLSITEIVKKTGIPRSTIYDRIKHIRNGLITAGVSRSCAEARTVVGPTE